MAIAEKDPQGRWFCTKCGTMTNEKGVLFTSAQAVKGHSRSCVGNVKESRQLKVAKARQARGETLVDGVPDPEFMTATPALQNTLSGLGTSEPLFGSVGGSITQDQYAAMMHRQDLILARLGNIEQTRHVATHNDSTHILGFEKKKFWMAVGALGVIGLIIYLSRNQGSGAVAGLEDCDERYDDVFLKTSDDEKAIAAKRNCQLHNSRISRRGGGGGGLGGLGVMNPLMSALAGAAGRSLAKKFF